MIRTGGLTFDKTAPVVSSLQLTGSLTGGMGLSFTTNELARFTLHYQLP